MDALQKQQRDRAEFSETRLTPVWVLPRKRNDFDKGKYEPTVLQDRMLHHGFGSVFVSHHHLAQVQISAKKGRAKHGHAQPLPSRERRPQAWDTSRKERTQAKAEHRHRPKQTKGRGGDQIDRRALGQKIHWFINGSD